MLKPAVHYFLGWTCLGLTVWGGVGWGIELGKEEEF